MCIQNSDGTVSGDPVEDDYCDEDDVEEGEGEEGFDEEGEGMEFMDSAFSFQQSLLSTAHLAVSDPTTNSSKLSYRIQV